MLIAGLLPNPELALDSLAVCTTILGWASMISVGYNAAASVRVSNELGAEHPKSASFCVLVATMSLFIISILFAILVMSLRHVMSYAFTAGDTIAKATSELAPLLAVSIVPKCPNCCIWCCC